MPTPTRNSACVVRTEVRQAGGGGRPFHGCHVHMGRQVLPPDMDIRVVVDAMAQVCPECPFAATDRVVQLRRRVAVVDEEERTATKAGGHLHHPRVEGQADLRALTLSQRHATGQRHAGGGESRRDAWRRRLRLDVDEGALSRTDQDLAKEPVADHDPVDRQRVEHLVAEDDALDRLESDPVALLAIDQHAGTTGLLEARDDRIDPARLHLDRPP